MATERIAGGISWAADCEGLWRSPPALTLRWCPDHGFGDWRDAPEGHWVDHPNARSSLCGHEAQVLVYSLDIRPVQVVGCTA